KKLGFNPKSSEEKLKEPVEIYEIDEYKAYVQHCSDYKYHMENGIKDFLKRGVESDYLDYWLFVLLHLNNAWRAINIRKFPVCR
ncbi:hypothetical protein, partial [Pseudomonas syringae group genomosp. 7]|uniref:hypothetical protein n=1 Tax=Pseudomonas syringae group genomosp. 7 TaxID=251699 RepID=UPI0037700703